MSDDETNDLKLKRPRGRPVEGSQALPIYGSMNACAAATGIPLWIIKQAKDSGCEAFRYSRVDLAKLLPFLFRDGKSEGDELDPANPTAKGKGWHEVWKMWQAKREELKYQNDVKQLVKRSEIQHAVQSAIATFFGEVDRLMLNEMPPKLHGLDATQTRQKLQMALEELKERLRAAFQAMAEGTEEGKE